VVGDHGPPALAVFGTGSTVEFACELPRAEVAGVSAGASAVVSRWDLAAVFVEAAHAKAAAKLEDVADDLRRLMGEGLTLSAMAARLNAEHIRTSRGCAGTATAVKRALARL
jgi:hypothetical protein